VTRTKSGRRAAVRLTGGLLVRFLILVSYRMQSLVLELKPYLSQQFKRFEGRNNFGMTDSSLTDQVAQTSELARVRRRLRKGTQSCTECKLLALSLQTSPRRVPAQLTFRRSSPEDTLCLSFCKFVFMHPMLNPWLSMH
jgi:hypothetical protein